VLIVRCQNIVYDLTEEGKRAPLRRVELSDPMPDDVTVHGQAHFTPTFILLRDGAEIGRIEGVTSRFVRQTTFSRTNHEHSAAPI
jgi:hypothetical protein